MPVAILLPPLPFHLLSSPGWGKQVGTALAVTGLRVEYLTDPLGIDAARPRLSWRLTTTERNTVQAAYQLQVARSVTDLARGEKLLWDSGRIASDASVFV